MEEHGKATRYGNKWEEMEQDIVVKIKKSLQCAKKLKKVELCVLKVKTRIVEAFLSYTLTQYKNDILKEERKILFIERKVKQMDHVFMSFVQSNFVRCVMALVVMDTIFGCLRAIKEKSFNSNIGINGTIRKVGMLLSLVCCAYLDTIISLNLIGFIPDAIRAYLPVDHIGITEFFAVIYIVYEILSVLKNMTLSGLPVGKIWKKLKEFLTENTGEIVDSDDEEVKEHE